MEDASSILDDIATELALDLVASGDSPTDFHDIASAYATSDLLDERLDGMTLDERLAVFEPAGYDYREWLGHHNEFNSGSTAVNQILHGMYVTSIRQAVQTYEDDIEVAVSIHTALSDLVETEYLVDDWPNPSEVVHAFFTWVGEESSGGNTDYDDLDHSDFNETHVRALEPLDITNDILLDALWEWLSAAHPDALR
jgi:hypothetical protein